MAGRCLHGCAFLVIFVAAAWLWLPPILIRELILKRGLRQNNYADRHDIPEACPRFESIAHSSVQKNISYEKYRGVWYSFATNEPTQPSGICTCDRYNWDWQPQTPSSFAEQLDTVCRLWEGAEPMHLSLPMEGQTNITGTNAMMLEGAPQSGASLIPNFVVWIDPQYSACIRYSCKEKYLGVSVFQSIQIWTREPIANKDSPLGRRLMKQAHKLLNFSDEYIEYTDHNQHCDLLPPTSVVRQ